MRSRMAIAMVLLLVTAGCVLLLSRPREPAAATAIAKASTPQRVDIQRSTPASRRDERLLAVARAAAKLRAEPAAAPRQPPASRPAPASPTPLDAEDLATRAAEARLLKERLGNDPAAELDVVRRELARITRLRLADTFGGDH